MKEPVDHILRPRLPWRSEHDPAITECGYDASKVRTLTREEFFQRIKDLGERRTAMLTCMTCSDTAKRWKTWDEDPRLALQREIEWERGSHYWHTRDDRGHRLLDELTAIRALIDAHPDEFANLLQNTTERRLWLKLKAARLKDSGRGA